MNKFTKHTINRESELKEKEGATTRSLRELYDQHGGKITDTWSMYADELDRVLSVFRDQQIVILEIGVQNGGSLEIWSEYFPKAQKIVGVDIDPKCGELHFVNPRISVLVSDATSEEGKRKVLQQAPAFDVIIDDGSHKSSDIVRAFCRYFHVLNKGGFYIVEDLCCSYWTDHEGGLHNPLSAMAFFKRLTDITNYEHWRNNRSREYLLKEFSEKYEVSFENLDLAKIHSVEFTNSLCIIRKAAPDSNVIGKRMVVGAEECVTNGHKKTNQTLIHDIPVNIEDDTRLDVFEVINANNRLQDQLAEQEQVIQHLQAQADRAGQTNHRDSKKLAVMNEFTKHTIDNKSERKKKEEIEGTGERFLPWMEGAQIHYEHLHRYAFAAHFVKGKKVLDLACGEGYGTYMLAREAEYVAGVEIDKQTVQHARSRHLKDNLEFIEGSILAVPIESKKKFDVAVCFEGIEHVAEHDNLLSEVKRLLKDDGLFIVSTPNKAVYTDAPDYHNPFHIKELQFDEFQNLLKQYFTHIHVFGQRVYAGSNMWSIHQEKSHDYVEAIVKKGDMEFYFADRTSKEPRYFIALASNASLKSLTSITDSWLTDSSNILFNDYVRQLQGNIAQIAERDAQIAERDAQIAERDAQIAALLNSTSWRLTKPLRWLSNTIKSTRCLLRITLQIIKQKGGIWRTCAAVLRVYRCEGLAGVKYRIKQFQTGSQLNLVIVETSLRSPVPVLRSFKEKAFSIPEDATVSVIIPTLNASKYFPLLLPTLRNQKDLKQLEIVVVDSGSTDETLALAKEYGAQIVEIPPDKFSHSYSRNLGAEKATGDYLFFTVQDALPPSEDFLGEILSVFKANEVAAVSCAEFPREDADLFYRVACWNHYEFLGVNNGDRILSKPAIENYITLRQNGQLSDLACFIPRDLFMKYTYRYDFAEDLDLGIRLIRDGYRIAFLSSLKIIHSHNRPPFYYLKRGYVDQIFLTKIFPDYPKTSIKAERLANEIVFAHDVLNHFVTTELARIAVPCRTKKFIFAVSDVFTSIVKKGGAINLSHISPYIDEEFGAFLKKLKTHAHSLDKPVSGHKLALLQGVVNFVKETSFPYLTNSTEIIDEQMHKEFIAHLYKIFALLCGVNIANSFVASPDKVDDVLGEMRAELIGGV